MNSKWNVQEIFASDNVLEREIGKYRTLIIDFYDRCNHIEIYDCKKIYNQLIIYEDITEFLYRVKLYITIKSYSTDTTIENRTKRIVDEFCNCYKSKIEFFPLQISKHEEIKKVLDDRSLLNYRMYLANIFNEKRYFMNQSSEEIYKLKETTGYQALQQMYLDIFELASFKFKEYGAISYNQLLGLLNCNDDTIRKKASKTLGLFLKSNNDLFTSLFNYTVQDLYIDKELRGYQSIYDGVFRENEINFNDLNVLKRNIKSNCGIFQYHYRMRAKRESSAYIEGINFTSDFQRHIDFEKALNIIIKAVGKVSSNYSNQVLKLVKEQHIDFECKPGKQAGSICFAATPKIMPYIFVNYNGSINDLFTLAHEVGHAIHFMNLASTNSFLNFIPSNLYAEIIAVFFETLVCIEYLSDEKYSQDAILEVSDNIIGKLFRQAMNALFEISAREREGYADKIEIEDSWLELRKDFYGDTVRFYPYEKNNYWSIPHFICEPLLTALYSLSQMIALNLLEKKDKRNFFLCFDKFIRIGSNESFRDFLSSNFDVSMDSDAMWENAFKILKELISKAEDKNS